MAAKATQPNFLGKEKLNLNENFEGKVMERLGWSKRKWNEMGESDSKFQRMINSLRHWSVKLSKAVQKTSVVLGLFNEEKEVSLNLLSFMDAFIEMGVEDKIVGFNTFRNPKYICFSFESEEAKQYVVDNFKTLESSHVIYLHWALLPKATYVKIHWVPMEVPIEKLINFVSTFGLIEEYLREENKMMSGKSLKNGTVSFKVQLKSTVDVKDIPHLQVFEGLEFLINITGRQLMCLNCSLLGHKSAECPTPYCRKCKKMSIKIHLCNSDSTAKKTYASVVNANENMNIVDAIKEGAMGLSNKILFAGLQNALDKGNTKKVTVFDNKGEGIDCYGVSEDKTTFGNEIKESKVVNERENDEDELSSENSENEDVMNAMEQYCEQLHALKRDADSLKINSDSLIIDEKEKVGQSHLMDMETLSLKRKIGTVDHDSTVSLKDVLPQATYGRRGRGRRRSFTQKSEDLFSKMIDQQNIKELDSG